MPVYSFGEESPVKFTLSDKTATHYNEAVDKFFKAQRRFNQKFGRLWNPEADPIRLKWTRQQQKAWNEFGKILKNTIDKQGPIHANDFMDDFLVKNGAALVVATTSKKWGRIVYSAAVCGSLYVLLRGL